MFLKKIGRFIRPAIGFNVIATANTKGKGSDDGRFIGTNVLNEAFLERFPVTFEQDYPSPSSEQKILMNVADSLGINEPLFCQRLVDWADIIRAYSIFGKKEKAIQVCVNRFDEETKQSFMELYDKVDADINFSESEDKAYQEDA